MPRFFFHLSEPLDGPDVVGTEFPDIASAQRAAVVTLGRMMQDHPDALIAGGDMSVTVSDDKDLKLFTLVAYALRSAAFGVLIVEPTEPPPAS